MSALGKNPYRPGTNVRPTFLAGRDEAIRRTSLAARMRDFASAAARAVRWNAIDGMEFFIDPLASTKTGSTAQSVADAAQVALDHGHLGFALFLDEAQVLFDDHRAKRQEHPLSMLISAVAGLQSTGAPVALVLCGLPSLQANLLRARTYSERMFIGERVASLDKSAAREALIRPLDGTGMAAQDALVDEVINEVDGYPYFIQLWGAELWEAAKDLGALEFTPRLLEDTRPRIYRRLDRDFYEGRLSTLTAAEQDILLASRACEYPPLIVSELRAQTSKSEKYVNVLMGRLAEAGVIYREAKGTYRYTAPQFHQFLQRHAERSDYGRSD